MIDPDPPTSADPVDTRLMALQSWLSPGFPVGSFAYSHGLEWAVGTGRIHDRATATGWLEDLAEHGGLRNDAILLSVACRAATGGDWAMLVEANDLALALAGSRERLLETVTQGNAFQSAIAGAWDNAGMAAAREELPGAVAYPIAIGAACAAYGIATRDALRAYLAAAVGNLTSALVRLAVIGQSDAQRVIAGLLPMLELRVNQAQLENLDGIGGAAFLSDIAAMAHETQDTRLFRS